VYNSGFLSDPKELYRPLGEPCLDTNSLLYDTLELDVRSLEYSLLIQAKGTIRAGSPRGGKPAKESAGENENEV
jgi:hypothetical protein